MTPKVNSCFSQYSKSKINGSSTNLGSLAPYIVYYMVQVLFSSIRTEDVLEVERVKVYSC